MGDGRERETSINDKGAGHHGNRHTTKSHGTAQWGEERHGGEEEEEEEEEEERMGINKEGAEAV